MTKAKLINNVYQAMVNSGSAVTKLACEDIIALALIHIKLAVVEEDRFNMPGFGVFRRVFRHCRRGVNPQTGLAIKIPASWTVSFRPSPTFRRDITARPIESRRG